MTSRESKDKKWEQVQIKAFTSWVNGVLKDKGMQITDICEDLRDGVKLCTFLEAATNKRLPKWDKTPATKHHRIINQNVALGYITDILKIRLVGVGAEDLESGNQKLILGTLWSLFRKLRLESINEEGKSSEDGLLLWIRKQTDGYKGITINNFKDSFNDGLAFSALINRFNPEFLNYDDIDPSSKEQNLLNAFRIAEEKMGIPQLLEVEDLLTGNPDERSVTLYASLFFHAFVAAEKNMEQSSKRQELADKLTNLEMQLAAVSDEKEELQKKNAALEERVSLLEGDVQKRDNRIKELEDRIKQLEDEIKYLRERAIKDAELRALLENKISMLEQMLEENLAASGRSAEETSALAKALEAARKRSTDLDAELKRLEEERNSVLTSAEEKQRRLDELEERKRSLLGEIDSLRQRVEAEIKRRKEKAAECARLREEIERLKRRQIQHTKANVGLDVLRRNLEEHLEDMYRWRDLHELDLKDGSGEFDLNKVIADLQGKKFEDQLDYLDGKLQEENRNLRRIIKLKDSNSQLKDIVIKEGWLTMKGRKEWRRRYFKLIGSRFTYYEDDESDDVCGCIQLDQGCDVLRQKAVNEEGSTKKLWPLKITVGDRKLFVRAATKKERHAWFMVLTSKISHVNYIKQCEKTSARPDTRLVNLFSCENSPSLRLNGRKLSPEAVEALVKALPGRDDIVDLSIADAGVTDEQAKILAPVINKLSIKSIDLSGNELSGHGVGEFAKAFAAVEGLESVNFSNNKADDAASEGIAELLANRSSLSSLNVSKNKLSDKAAAAISEALKKATDSNVTALELADNQIGDAGAQSIASLLGSSKINDVNLSGNHIGDSGISALADALGKSNVSKINVAGNKFGVKGATALKNVMDSNSEITSIDISGTALTSGHDAGSILAGDGYKFPHLAIARS